MSFIWKEILIYFTLLSCLILCVTSVTADREALQHQQQKHRSYLSHHNHNHNHHHTQHHHPHPHPHEYHNHRREKSILPHSDAVVSLAGRHLKTQNATTRLRPLNTRDYYNKALQRRLNHQQRRSQAPEWDYHVYNVQTNTFGNAPSGLRPIKGDDNRQDVEFISVNSGSSSTKWPNYNSNRRSFGVSSTTTTTTTLGPPALVPARRGYTHLATSTQGPLVSEVSTEGITAPNNNDDSLETNTIFNRAHPPYEAKEMERRHICVQQRVITMPVKTTEIYTRPIWKHVTTPCKQSTQSNQMCTRVQLVHEQAFRDVIRHKSAQSVTYDCCNGWTRENSLAEGCMKPICGGRCQNGGNCIRPDTCSCTPGYTGRFCEFDVNECQEDKPCDQTCINTVGSYHCRCRDGFTLQADRQSCKKIALRDEDAFEARDLENEVDIGGGEEVSSRLHKIERSLANERVQTHELQRSLQATYNVVDTLKLRLSTLEKQQVDMNRLQSNLFATESRTNKLEGILNLLMKCRDGPNAHCP